MRRWPGDVGTRRGTHRCLLVSLALVAVGLPAVAAAPGATSSSNALRGVQASSCTGDAGRAFVESLRVELSRFEPVVEVWVAAQAPVHEATGGSVRIEDCRLEEGELVVSIRGPSAEDGGGIPPNRQVIELDDVELVARPRMAAVAVAELIASRALWAQEPEPAQAPSSPRPVQARVRPEPSEAQPARQAKPRLNPSPRNVEGTDLVRIGVHAHAGLFSEQENLVYGFSLGADINLAPRIRVVTSATYAETERESTYGLATLSWWGGGVGPDLLLVRSPELRVGARLSIARVSAMGQSVIGVAEPTQRGTVILGSGVLQVHFPLGGPWWVQTGLELGSAPKGIEFTAGGHSTLSISGLFTRWNAGVAVAF